MSAELRVVGPTGETQTPEEAAKLARRFIGATAARAARARERREAAEERAKAAAGELATARSREAVSAGAAARAAAGEARTRLASLVAGRRPAADVLGERRTAIRAREEAAARREAARGSVAEREVAFREAKEEFQRAAGEEISASRTAQFEAQLHGRFTDPERVRRQAAEAQKAAEERQAAREAGFLRSIARLEAGGAPRETIEAFERQQGMAIAPAATVTSVFEKPAVQRVSIEALEAARGRPFRVIEPQKERLLTGETVTGPPVVDSFRLTQPVSREPFRPQPLTEERAREITQAVAVAPEAKRAAREFIAEEEFKRTTGIARVEMLERGQVREFFTLAPPTTREPGIPERAAGMLLAPFARPTGVFIGAAESIARAPGLPPEQRAARQRVLFGQAGATAFEAATVIVPGVAARPLLRAAGVGVPPAGRTVLTQAVTRGPGERAVATFVRARGLPPPTARGAVEISTRAEVITTRQPSGVTVPVRAQIDVGRATVGIRALEVERIPPRGIAIRDVPPGRIRQPPEVKVTREGRVTEARVKVPEEFTGPRGEAFPVPSGTRIPLSRLRVQRVARRPPQEPPPPVRMQDVRRAEVVERAAGLPDMPPVETGIQAGGLTLPGMLVVPAPPVTRPSLAILGRETQVQVAVRAAARSGGAVVFESPLSLFPTPPAAVGRRAPVVESRAVGMQFGGLQVGRQRLVDVAPTRTVRDVSRLAETRTFREPERIAGPRPRPVIVEGVRDLTGVGFGFGTASGFDVGVGTGFRFDVAGAAAGLNRLAARAPPPEVERPPPEVERPPPRIGQPPPRIRPPPPVVLPFFPRQRPERRFAPRPPTRMGPPRRPRRATVPRASSMQVLVTELLRGPGRFRQPRPTRGTVAAFRRGVGRFGAGLEFPTQEQIEAGALGGRRRGRRRKGRERDVMLF